MNMNRNALRLELRKWRLNKCAKYVDAVLALPDALITSHLKRAKNVTFVENIFVLAKNI